MPCLPCPAGSCYAFLTSAYIICVGINYDNNNNNKGGRGNRNGAEWFISKLPEELDFPREFWYNTTEATMYFVSG